MAIQLDGEIASRLSAGMNDADGVDLPFAAPFLWVLNGQATYKRDGGAAYFGGWAATPESFEEVADATGLPLPAGWKHVTLSNREGGEYEAVTARHVLVAPIGRRESWRTETGRVAKYVEGARQHVQVLAYLAEKVENGQYQPWGPVVLTAKGYQARNLRDAFQKWDKVTSALRRKVAPGVPAWCFYLALGTFEKERQTQQVGKGSNTSPITPITAYIPADLDEAALERLFVGQEVAAIMADLMEQAQDWLKAWQGDEQAEAGQDNGEPDLSPPNWDNEQPF